MFSSPRRSVCVGLFALVSIHAFAQSDYPNKPVTLMVGYQPGGSVDLVARTIGPSLSRRLGQPVIVENAPGAGGTVAATKVVNAAPDGYTLLVGSPSEVGINQLTNKKLRYDALKDFEPIGYIGNQPMVLVSHSKVPVSDTASFLEHVGSRPGRAMFASAGVGTPLHLAGELIKQKAGVSIDHVPYRGAASMTTDLLGGQIDFAVFVLSSALPYVKDGRMKAIGVTSNQRTAAAPDIPSLAENPRLKGMDMSIWFGLLAPRGTPQPITDRLDMALKAVLAEPEVSKRLQEAGVTLAQEADFPRFIRKEVDKFKAIVDFAKIAE